MAGITRSELEDRFLRFLADRELPAPRPTFGCSSEKTGWKGDCVWADHGVVVELDSWCHHSSKGAPRRDRTRDRRLRLAGWEAIRVTSWDLDEDAERPGDRPARSHQRTSCHSMTP